MDLALWVLITKHKILIILIEIDIFRHWDRRLSCRGV
jgi:hypothetical protein